MLEDQKTEVMEESQFDMEPVKEVSSRRHLEPSHTYTLINKEHLVHNDPQILAEKEQN